MGGRTTTVTVMSAGQERLAGLETDVTAAQNHRAAARRGELRDLFQVFEIAQGVNAGEIRAGNGKLGARAPVARMRRSKVSWVPSSKSKDGQAEACRHLVQHTDLKVRPRASRSRGFDAPAST